MTYTAEELDVSKHSRKSLSSHQNVTAPGTSTARIPEADIEIRIAEGADGARLADLQARILREVTK